MSILGLIISLVFFLIAIAVVAHPFLRPPQASARADAQLQRQGDRVQIYYERVLTNMRDLDEDYATGKLDEADYNTERELWAQRGIRLLRARDSLDARQSLIRDQDAKADTIDAATDAAIDAAIEEAVEAAVAAYRAGAGAAIPDQAASEAN